MAAGGHFDLKKNKACVSHNCNTNARIKFIIDTAIDDLEWKNPIDFGAKSEKPKWPPVAILWKYDEKACALYNLITDQLHIWCSHWHTIEGGPYRFWQKSESKMAAFLHVSPIFPNFPHLSPLNPTFHHFFQLFATFHHFSPLFTTFYAPGDDSPHGGILLLLCPYVCMYVRMSEFG